MNEAGTAIDSLRVKPNLPIVSGETASSAVAAKARAMVLARYEMAIRQKRDWDEVRQDLLKECKRPAFANNKSALYRKPIGDGIEGLGIRFVEVALRCMKNVLIESEMVFEDEMKEVHCITVTDLESNTTYPQDVKVSKTVERKKPLDDGSFLSVRQNSYGKPVYTVLANDDDLLNKRASLVSKAIRTLGLRIIPGDLQDEAEDIIRSIRKQEAAKDPDAARRAMVDAFGELNIKVEQLVEYLGHPLDEVTPTEIVELRGYYAAIKDDETTWRAVMESKRERTGAVEEGKPAAGTETKDLRRAGSAAAKPAAEEKKAAAPAETAKAEPVKEEKKTTARQRTLLPVVTVRGRAISEIAFMPTLGEVIEVDGARWHVLEIHEDRVVVDVGKPVEHPQAAAQQVSTSKPLDLFDVMDEINNAATEEQLAAIEKQFPLLDENSSRLAQQGSDRRRKQGFAQSVAEELRPLVEDSRPRRQRGGNLE